MTSADTGSTRLSKDGGTGTPQGGADHGHGHGSGTDAAPGGGLVAKLVVAWAVVGIPLAYGVYKTVEKAQALFT